MQTYYIIGLVTACLAFFLKNKKISLLSAVILFLLLTSVRTGNDVTNYLNAYNRIESDYEFHIMDEPLYKFTELTVKSFGFDFYWFKAILTLIAFLLLYNVIKRYTDNFGFILLHYYIYFLFVDCQQFRNFLALTILIVAIDAYVRYNSKIKYLLLNFAAFGFHTAFAFYFSMVFLFQKFSKRMLQLFAGCMIIYIGLCIYDRDWLVLLERVQLIFQDTRGRVSAYFGLRARWGFLPAAVLHFCGLYLFIREKKRLKNCWQNTGTATGWKLDGWNLKKEKKEEIINKMMDLSFYANLLIIACIPFSMLSLVFYRFIRNMYFINLIPFSIISSSLKEQKVEKAIFHAAVLVISLTWLIYDAYFYYGVEETFDLVFNGELFWK